MISVICYGCIFKCSRAGGLLVMRKVNIIGGGLAGTALAYMLKSRGAVPIIYEASPDVASGASGNDIGIYNPRFSAQLDAEAKFYSDAFFKACSVFEEFGDDVEFNPCGSLSLLNNERKDVRYRKTVDSWGWSKDDMRIVGAREASDMAGIEIPHDALYLPKSGSVSPKKLCQLYSKDIEVNLNHKIKDFSELEGDVTIIACGIGALKFEASENLPLKSVRGQVSFVDQNKLSKNLKLVLNYGGYMAPAKDGVHVVGSTFQPWLSHDDILPEDNLINLDKLFEAIPSIEGDYNVVDSRAAVRTASKNHFPIVGQLGQGLYISVAHGSHGILSSIMAASILADMIVDSDYSAPYELLTALSPNRFSR